MKTEIGEINTEAREFEENFDFAIITDHQKRAMH